MARRRTSFPAWRSCLAVLVLIGQASSLGTAVPVSRSSSSPGLAVDDLRSSGADDMTANGIAIVGPEAIQARPADEDQAGAFNAALELAYAHRDALGYPWLESESGLLELSFATGLGEAIAASAVDRLSTGGRRVRLRPAQASIAELDALADAITRLNATGVPGADRIWMTEPDQKNNRVVITVSEPNDELFSVLGSQYDPSLIAIRIRPREPASTASRDSDSPPFWGGAYWKRQDGVYCTTGFAWNVGGGVSGMLTAAHCIPQGGSVSYPNYPNAGSVRRDSEENWDATYGTQYYSGQNVYRGDVALIRYASYASAPYVYSGAPHTSTYSAVYGMASRWSSVGDAACVNGVTTGEWCGMVTATGVNVWYVFDGPNVWARHVVRAEAAGNTCPTHGDSGGPVYRKRSDGKVYAVGIYSGGAPLVAWCLAYFTDIWDAYYGLPGTLKTTG